MRLSRRGFIAGTLGSLFLSLIPGKKAFSEKIDAVEAGYTFSDSPLDRLNTATLKYIRSHPRYPRYIDTIFQEDPLLTYLKKNYHPQR